MLTTPTDPPPPFVPYRPCVDLDEGRLYLDNLSDLGAAEGFKFDAVCVARWMNRALRFNSHGRGRVPLTIAEHTLLVHDIAVCTTPPSTPRPFSTAIRAAALVHDMPEYVTGDIITPIKRLAGFALLELELSIESALIRDLLPGLPSEVVYEMRSKFVVDHVKRADTAALVVEAAALGFDVADYPPVLPSDLTMARNFIGEVYRGERGDAAAGVLGWLAWLNEREKADGQA